MPGSTADAELLYNANPDIEVITLRLLELDPEAIDAELPNAIDAAVNEIGDNYVHVVGFSIGAMAAIKIAASRPNLVSRLTLISPAAPLSSGEFLDKMAGKPVFELALKQPKILRLLTRFQGLVTRFSPNTMIKMLFAKCGPVEKDLLEDQAFIGVMKMALLESFVQSPTTYLGYISAYVADWGDSLSGVLCPVELWHGTKDTWSPPEMSKYLADEIGEKATLNLVQDAEHYSTLTQAKL
jgi:pimeloyl-ACP methyl ester carboxylesterase